MPSPVTGDAFVTAFDTVAFAFGCTQAAALPGPVLTHLLTDLGMTTSAAKALVHRMTTVDCLALERRGRVGVYKMTGMFLEQFEAFRDDDWTREPWDGRFHTLVYDIPEHERRVRDQLRAAAVRVGYRQLRPGVLIGPRDASGALEFFTQGHAITGGWWEIDREQVGEIVRACWGLDDIRARYVRALAGVDRLLATDLESLPGAQAYRTMHASMRPLVELSLQDGQLPHELLPADWPAPALQAAIGALTARLGPAIGRHVAEVVAASPHAALLEHDPVSEPADALSRGGRSSVPR